MSLLPSWRIGKLLLPYLALVFIHVLSGLQMEQPIILADELGYLGNARFLSGSGPLPNMHGSQFYHFGYSLFLLPAFWLFSDPISTYKAALTINALLISALYFPLFFILESFLEVPKSAARWIAFTCCLYPSLILYSSFAWTENAFIPLYATAAALFGMYLTSRTSRNALLFGFVVGFLYTLHPRALPILAIVVVYLVVLALVNILPKVQVLLSVSMIGLVFTLTRAVNGHLKAMGWGGGGELSAAKLGGRLLGVSDLLLLVERALGQLLYLSLASHGLFLVGVVAVIWQILPKVASGSLARVVTSPRTGVPLFVLATASGVFVASCAVNLYSYGPGGVRATAFIHGRYNEALAVLVLAFALAAFCGSRLPMRQLIAVTLGVVVTTLFLTVVTATQVDDALDGLDGLHGRAPTELVDAIPPTKVIAVAVPGVYPLVGFFGGLKLYAMSLAAMGSFLMITVAMRFTTRGGMVLLMGMFAAFSIYNHQHYLLPAVATARPRLAFVEQINRVGPIEAISYDAAHRESEVFFGAQYLLPSTAFNLFDSRKHELPASEAVISGNKWRQARRLKARLIVSSGWDNALWVLPGELQSRLPLVFYEGVTLGAEPKFGFQETGFYLPERFRGEPGRWTNGAAVLKVPLDPASPPRLLQIDTIVPGRDGAELRVVANGVELWRQTIPSEAWSRTFNLAGVPMNDELHIEINSDTFTPAKQREEAIDERSLGVVVTGIRLTARDHF